MEGRKGRGRSIKDLSFSPNGVKKNMGNKTPLSLISFFFNFSLCVFQPTPQPTTNENILPGAYIFLE
jgi:hypothetical protein